MNEHGRSTAQVRILIEVEAYDANFTNKFTFKVSHLYSEAACSHGQGQCLTILTCYAHRFWFLAFRICLGS